MLTALALTSPGLIAVQPTASPLLCTASTDEFAKYFQDSNYYLHILTSLTSKYYTYLYLELPGEKIQGDSTAKGQGDASLVL